MPKLRLRDFKVRDFMSREVVTGTADEPVSELLPRMHSHDIHEIPILDRKKLVGLVAMRAISRRKAPPDTKAKTLLESAPEASPDLGLAEAAELLLSSGHRSLPIGEKGKLVGILSRTDIIRALAGSEEIAGLTVDEVMTPQPQCVSSEETVVQARTVMADLGERAVPVVDPHRRLVGVVGIKDIADLFLRPKGRPRELGGDKEAVKVTVGSVMRPPVSVPPGSPLPKALDLMVKHNISTMIVEADREPVGIITSLDLVELAARFRAREGLLVQISGLEEQSDVYDAMYDIIQKAMRRVSGLVTPRVLNLHVVVQKAEGDKSKWSLRARFATDHEMHHLKHFDWDLFKALDGLLDQLEARIKEQKDLRVSARKRHHGS